MKSRSSTLRQIAGAGLVTLTVSSGAGCGARREPVYMDPALAEGAYQIATVALMPVIDVRPDPFDHVHILSHARYVSERILGDKGYTVVPETASRGGKPLGSAELAKLTDAELAELGPPDREYLLYIYVERLEKGFDEFGAESRVTVSGVLFRRSAKQAVWRDRAVGESNLVGLLTVLSGPTTEYEAVYQAIRVLFSTMPDHKKA